VPPNGLGRYADAQLNCEKLAWQARVSSVQWDDAFLYKIFNSFSTYNWLRERRHHKRLKQKRCFRLRLIAAGCIGLYYYILCVIRMEGDCHSFITCFLVYHRKKCVELVFVQDGVSHYGFVIIFIFFSLRSLLQKNASKPETQRRTDLFIQYTLAIWQVLIYSIYCGNFVVSRWKQKKTSLIFPTLLKKLTANKYNTISLFFWKWILRKRESKELPHSSRSSSRRFENIIITRFALQQCVYKIWSSLKLCYKLSIFCIICKND
jgi:hypothetical protein